MELKGKPLSLGSKIVAATVAIGGLLFKATIAPALDIDAVLKVAFFVVAIFGTIDISMIAGNIFGNRKRDL